MDQQFLAQGLSRSTLYQLTIGIALYVVDVLPQWTSLKCGLPHQFSLRTFGGPEAGWHLDMHRHVTAVPLLASHGEASGGEGVQGTSIHVGAATDRKQSQIPAPPWLGSMLVWMALLPGLRSLPWHPSGTSGHHAGSCVLGRRERRQRTLQTLWQVDPCTGSAVYDGRGPTRAKHVAGCVTHPTLEGG